MMHDPLHDQVPHMVPHSPDWAVGYFEAIALGFLLGIAIIGITLLWVMP
jgi:hypothetical protein